MKLDVKNGIWMAIFARFVERCCPLSGWSPTLRPEGR